MNDNTPVGFYGKLPIIGDFVSRRLPDDFINAWDSWLQSIIAASREARGEDWLTGYLTSPIWRFVLSPGVCGNKAVAGIVMPSVDRVGRYYPMTVARVFDSSFQLPFMFTVANDWFEQLEDAALIGLEGKLDLLAFDQLIQTIPPLSFPPGSLSVHPSVAEKKSFYIPITNIGHTAEAFIALNAQLLATFMPGYSLWSNAGSEHVQAALVAYEGLPAIGGFPGFLNGKENTVHKELSVNFMGKLLNNIAKPEFAPFAVAAAEPENLSLEKILSNNEPVLMDSSWCSWAITHTGKQRKHNEDAFLNRPEAGLWVVADGMGGHKAGDIASQLIVNNLKDLSCVFHLEEYVKAVEQRLKNVNTQLQQLSDKEYDHQMVGSTVVCLMCEAKRCAFAWAGDSRLYRLRNNTLQQLTQDHCVHPDLTATDWTAKHSNVITRAIGAREDLALEINMLEVFDEDVFLLCSDGLDKELSFREIESIMSHCEAQAIADKLVNEALMRGARDNVTVIVVAKNNVLN
ncbi:MAG: type VI secretion system-associated protein TagF [Methylococcales bacterium]